MYKCKNCGRKSCISHLSKLMFSESDKEQILKGIGWISTAHGWFCPVCSEPKTRKEVKEIMNKYIKE